MASKREMTEKLILDDIQSLTPNSDKNRKVYEARFKSMNDEEFQRWIERLDCGEEHLMIVSPNHSNDGLSLENNLKVADNIGHDFFTHVQVVGKPGIPNHITPVRYMVIDLPIRRLSQTSDKKIKVPKSTKVIDTLTGQVTGESKGASISAPELQVLAAMGLEAPLIEVMKYRGGDIKGRNALNAIMVKDGQVRLEGLDRFASGVESTLSLKTFLTAAMLKNSL